VDANQVALSSWAYGTHSLGLLGEGSNLQLNILLDLYWSGLVLCSGVLSDGPPNVYKVGV